MSSLDLLERFASQQPAKSLLASTAGGGAGGPPSVTSRASVAQSVLSYGSDLWASEGAADLAAAPQSRPSAPALVVELVENVVRLPDDPDASVELVLSETAYVVSAPLRVRGSRRAELLTMRCGA